ncbi:MAG: hypothetical protein KGJ07_00165 [Patescibacteria group bacterium]|nr:hypothetical protein [Patescibacteria group bacterium]
MSITVKKLISELEKIPNKFLEVEVFDKTHNFGYHEINRLVTAGKKVRIIIGECIKSESIAYDNVT